MYLFNRHHFLTNCNNRNTNMRITGKRRVIRIIKENIISIIKESIKKE